MAHEIKLNNGFNCRDLAGYRTHDGEQIKPKKLIRAGYLSDLDNDDQEILYQYGIRTVIDLRSPGEMARYPDHLDSRIRVVKLPISTQDLSTSPTNVRRLSQNLVDKKAGLRQMLQAYEWLITSVEAQAAYRQFMLTLLEPATGGTLFHCSMGKDRTGVLTILILKALMIPDDVVQKDYLMSNELLAVNINQQLSAAKRTSDNLAYLQSIFDISTVRTVYFTRLLDIVTARYGGFSTFFHEQLGLRESDLERFRQLYLIR